MGIRRSLSYLSLVTALCGAVACSDSTEPESDADPVLAAGSGNAQSGDVGEALGNPIVVRVTKDGTPVAGTSVSWSVTGGGGSVSPAASTTNASGNASTIWTLGPAAGANTVQAAVTGATGSPVTFTATGVEVTGPPMTASVSVVDYAFNPDNSTVAAGGTVTWTWNGSDQHNVTFSDAASGNQASGTYTRTFSTAGTFPYQCTLHSGMNGTIVVE